LPTRSGTVNYSRLGPATYVLDAASGRFVYADDPYTDSIGRVASRSLYPLHTGQVAGGWGMAFAFVLGAVTFIQCVTGVYVWWKRRGGRVAARKARRAGRRGQAEAAA
jgi:uncharacterized iron-regulated membrane protein